jgi:integrase
MKTKLTALLVKNLPIPLRKEVYRDTEVIGFGVEIRASGEATYWFYCQINGRLRQLRIGRVQDLTFDQAKREAKRLRSEVTLGRDPHAERVERRSTMLFKELSAAVVDHAKAHLKSHASVEIAHRLYLVPRFGKERIDAITPQMIERYFTELRPRLSPASVDRLRLVMNRCYRLAAAWNLPGSDRNPVASVARPRYDNKRTCLLSPEEVERLLAACEKSQNRLLKPIVQLLLATAARKRELLYAKVEHIDMERAELLLPMTKNGRSRRVPLSKAAIAVIKDLPRPSGSPWLLTNPKTGLPFDDIKHGWHAACKAASLPGLRIHDLRHAAIGAMINNGVDLFVAGRVAGHLRPESTARYAFVADKTLAAAVEAGSANLNL